MYDNTVTVKYYDFNRFEHVYELYSNGHCEKFYH